MTTDLPQDRFFPIKTSWTLIAEARAKDASGGSAREEFANRYLRPVRDYILALTGNIDHADDLAQGFFADVVVPGRLLSRLDSTRGSFRPFLKQAVRNYLIDAARSRNRKKRRPIAEVRPDEWSDAGWDRLNLQAQTGADAAFHRAWVHDLLKEALVRVNALCEQRQQTEHFELFVGRYLSDSQEPPSWRVLGAQFGLEEKLARSRADTVARHFRSVLRQMLREELGSDELVDQEIATLLAFI